MYCVAFQNRRDGNDNYWYICTVGDAGQDIDFRTFSGEQAHLHLHKMKRYHPKVDYKVMNYETVKMLNELTGDF